MEGLSKAVSIELEVPPAVTELPPVPTGPGFRMGAEAYELARQVYYEQHGSMMDAARAILAAGLAPDTENVIVVHGRLQTWWESRRWAKRPTNATFAIRDANHDGGLYRGERACAATTSGNGPMPKGMPCGHTALEDSQFCYHHDPRFEAKRRKQTAKMTASRRHGLVPLGPFYEWADRERKRLLEEARAAGDIRHPNDEGWGRLAAAIGVTPTGLWRAITGVHSRKAKDGGGNEIRSKVKARTVIRYVEPLGFTFEDVYGYPPPDDIGAAVRQICPECGGVKNPESKLCRPCHEATLGDPCTYTSKHGRRCSVRTRRESGLCQKHEVFANKIRKPRSEYNYRTGFFKKHPEVVIYALDEYRRCPELAWVAKRMWACNVGDVRGHYSKLNSLTGQLVKDFRKAGWDTDEAREAAYRELRREHGAPVWPAPDQPLAAGGLLPFAPFRNWLIERVEQVGRYRGVYKELGAMLTMDPYLLSEYVRGEGKAKNKRTVRRERVEDALAAWGGYTVDDLYGGGKSE